MSKIIVTIANLERLPDRPYPITGTNGRPICHSHLNHETGQHEIQMPLEEWLAMQREVAKGFERSYGKWILARADVTLDDCEKVLADELDKARAEIASLKGQISTPSAAGAHVDRGEPGQGLDVLPIETKPSAEPPSEDGAVRTRESLHGKNFRTLRAWARDEKRDGWQAITDIEEMKTLLLAEVVAAEATA